jgi:hypothetical protein
VILQSQPSGADAWLVVAGASSLLALPSSESARLSDLAARLDAPDGFRAALENLVGQGIAGAPPFALLDGDAGVLRVVVRGDAAVAAQLADSEVVFSGLGVATWTERVLEGATRVRLTVPGSIWTVLLEAGAGMPVTAPAAAASVESAPESAPGTVPEGAAVSAAAAPAETTWAPNSQPEQPRPEQPGPERPRPERRDPSPRPVLEEPQADPDSEAYDFLFGDTIYRTQAGASIRIPNPDPERPGDHDGQTMLASDLGRPIAAGGEPVDASVSEATVLAPIPPRGAPPAVAAPAAPRSDARRPDAPRTDAPSADPTEHAPSLPLGPTLQLERADGTREALNRPVLIGRSPAASGSASDARLITIVDDPDISRTHLRVAVEGDAVVVTDLGSKNGSIITLPGAAPRKLRASEPTVVLPGTLIDLGGGTTFMVRED